MVVRSFNFIGEAKWHKISINVIFVKITKGIPAIYATQPRLLVHFKFELL